MYGKAKMDRSQEMCLITMAVTRRELEWLYAMFNWSPLVKLINNDDGLDTMSAMSHGFPATFRRMVQFSIRDAHVINKDFHVNYYPKFEQITNALTERSRADEAAISFD